MSEDRAIHRAQLADMTLEEILSFLMDKGFAVTLCKPGYRAWAEGAVADRLPPGYPPWADGDDYTLERLPFDNDRDGR